MHNNFYFLRQLSSALASRLTGAVVSECFSQSKDELIIRFEIHQHSFFVRASLLPDFSCLSFPENFQRARKNSVDLFPELVGRHVLQVRQFANERSFSLHLSGDHDLLFKMHGNRTNIVLFREGKVVGLFRKNLAADLGLNLQELDRDIDWSYEAFLKHAGNPRSLYFTFGKVVWTHLEEQGYFARTTEEQWIMLQSVLEMLGHPVYHIAYINGRPALSLVRTGHVEKTLSEPVKAANEFFHTFTQVYALTKEKSAWIQALRTKLEAGKNYCAKNAARLAGIRGDNHYRMWADLLMANLHIIPSGSDRVVLPNYYHENRAEEIRLKKDLSPQKNAEVFYRKAKNQHIEIRNLEESLVRKEAELEQLRRRIAEIEAISDLRSLRALKSLTVAAGGGGNSPAMPFHEFQLRGFRIWVGRNAQSNDILTFKHSYKEDLWLHAKDVSGSHVLIKHQAGKNYPRDVVEFAASLAAYHSQRKNESLCPVTVTPKKFVRKRKGDPPGAVVVEREDVILVPPVKPS